jgi:formylglycine-generating enzyme
MSRRAALALAGALLAPPAWTAADMVRSPAGAARIGSDRGRADERPAFTARVAAFELDRTPVTVAAFARFVERTRHVTAAERNGHSAVMTFGTGQWAPLAGASWRRPEGPSGPAAAGAHPVTHVSWHDAASYCAAAGKRLPTEVEWEHAARAGGTPERSFGDALVQNGRYRANVWTGVFPVLNTAADGFRTTSPVGAFGSSALGLTDMAGNVWEWMADWYRPYSEAPLPTAGSAGGPPLSPLRGARERAQRGGSFLCDPKFCSGFRLTARGHAAPDTSHMHVGFRCARDARDPTT